jgi:hypothetical protein
MSDGRDGLERELYRTEDEIRALLRSDGFVEDLVRLEQRRKILEAELYDWNAIVPLKIAGKR